MGKVAGVARMPFLNAVFETEIAESHADGQPVSAASGLYESLAVGRLRALRGS